MSPVIRPALPADAVEIARLQVASWQVAYRGLLPDDYLETLKVEPRVRMWLEMLQQAPPTVLVVMADERIAGFCHVVASRDADACAATGEITSIYLDPVFWQQGYGRALATAAMEQAWSQGFVKLTLWVLRGNERARRFYEKMGFLPDGAEKIKERPGFVLDEVRYRREIGI